MLACVVHLLSVHRFRIIVDDNLFLPKLSTGDVMTIMADDICEFVSASINLETPEVLLEVLYLGHYSSIDIEDDLNLTL